MIKVIWHGEKVSKEMERNVPKFLHGAGNILINQMGENAHKITGTLANSMNYKLSSGEGSGFSSNHGEGSPPTSAKVSNPGNDNSVRAGSALVYAGPQEGHNQWATKSMDHTRRPIIELFKRVFRI
ncbi:MAG TPA: hypothetical protein VMZ04_07075 [Anaerolineae bacterium]|nr:hypothetical protein [Anaerolineae bacterium]